MGVCVAVTGYVGSGSHTHTFTHYCEAERSRICVAHTCTEDCVCVWSEGLCWSGKKSQRGSQLKELSAGREGRQVNTAECFSEENRQSLGIMMTMKRTLCRFCCLLTVVVELSWLNMGHSMHREGGNRPTSRGDVMKQWERKVRSASSLDELLRLADFPDWKLWKCRLRLQQPEPQTENITSSPLVGSHRSTRYAAESYSLEILKAIDEEWQRTQCMPRETCVDVAKELGTDPAIFFKPPCVSIHRCSGCCNQEGITCRNTTTVYVNKTVLRVIPFNFVPEPVLIKVANHTECRCMEPAIIRRNAQPYSTLGCSLMAQLSEADDSRRLCATGLIWDCSADRCIPYPSSTPELPISSWMPDCEIDVERCDCLPRLTPTLQPRPKYRCQLNASICTHRRQRFDQTSCRCKLPK